MDSPGRRGEGFKNNLGCLEAVLMLVEVRPGALVLARGKVGRGPRVGGVAFEEGTEPKIKGAPQRGSSKLCIFLPRLLLRTEVKAPSGPRTLRGRLECGSVGIVIDEDDELSRK